MQTQDFLTYSVGKLIGQVAETSLSQIDSYVAEDAIEFGAAVKRGTDKAKQILALTGATGFLGIAVRNEARYEGNYPADTMASVMTVGRVVVQVGNTQTAAIVAGDPAKLHTDGTFIKGTGTGDIGTFLSPAAKNELVILEIK